MANNKVSSLFNQTLPKPPRSNFNLGRVNRFTADVGYVIPCYVEEVLPNSYKRLDLEALIQTNATVAPLMGSFTAKFEAFFVPLRLYHMHLDLNNIRPDFHEDFDFHYIELLNRNSTVSIPSVRFNIDGAPFEGESPFENIASGLSVAPGSLIDYLGLMPVGLNSYAYDGSEVKMLNGTPFIGYFDIYRNYYANPHDRMIPYRVQNFTLRDDDSIKRYGEVKYFNLDDLDSFIVAVHKGSMLGDVPNPVPVLTQFFNHVGDASWRSIPGSPKNSQSSVPLFAGQAIWNYNAETGMRDYVYDTFNGLHFGLLPRTYKDDYFNSRFMNEFVNYMEQTAVVTVQNNQFTIQQLRLQNRVAKYVDKSIFSDTRFGSWIKAHFGVKTNSKLNIPQFLGSMSGNLIFNDIYSTAQTGDGDITSNQALGSRSSLGQGYVKGKGSFVEFKATEPGYIMVMFSLVPNVNYFQGIRKMYLKNRFNDLYTPEFDAVGYQDLQRLELDAIGVYYPSNVAYDDDPQNPSANPPRGLGVNTINYSVGKQPSWIEYMTAVDEVHGLMTKRYEFGYWTLNRPFRPDIYDELAVDYGSNANTGDLTSDFLIGYEPVIDTPNATTYIQPELFNTIFAVDKYTDNFQVQVRFYDKTKQPMSKQILPHL